MGHIINQIRRIYGPDSICMQKHIHTRRFVIMQLLFIGEFTSLTVVVGARVSHRSGERGSS